ncbi:hypothetical protein [Sphingomonas crusticola]|uniref:hypothetical protein n=1 Tax=Sphingomonas crusticola TaxID=1697973 RepID=UPI000E273BD2|nr:hypothetical protein [Sphingomonas crusticola]
MHKSVALFAVTAAVMSAPASAQIQPDFTQIGAAVNAIAFPVTMNMCNAGLCGPQKGTAGVRGRPGKAAAGARGGPAVAPNGPASVGMYQPSGALAREAVAAYVQRVRRTNPQLADQVAREFGKRDYQTMYRQLVGDAGFRSDSVSDAMAAYMAVTWVIANGFTHEPSRAEALGLRRQFAARIAGNALVLANRAKLGEELKLLIVTVYSGFKSAQTEGNQRQYADGVTAMIRKQYGVDLRAVRLTPTGFVDRS